MKLLSTLVLSTALAVSSAAIARVAPESNALAPLASYGTPERRVPARMAGYPEPEGHTQPQIAAYPEPEGHTQAQIALN
jgi:hypothetical protein